MSVVLYPDLYAVCMFVDGQWDVSTLKGLEDQVFVYFAAEDDTSAWNGAQEVMEMFDANSAPYKYAQWDGNWSVDELSTAAKELFTEDADQYFMGDWDNRAKKRWNGRIRRTRRRFWRTWRIWQLSGKTA